MSSRKSSRITFLNTPTYCFLNVTPRCTEYCCELRKQLNQWLNTSNCNCLKHALLSTLRPHHGNGGNQQNIVWHGVQEQIYYEWKRPIRPVHHKLIHNVSLWLWGSHNYYDFNDDESWTFMKMEYFSDYQLDSWDAHILFKKIIQNISFPVPYMISFR